jgi:N-acylneuraminate cytidylyltransferase
VIIDAVIPARGGSKRLPNKNLADLAGTPLVAHTIRFALEHPRIRRVLVTTDAGPIADLARQMGTEVVDRPAELSTDVAPTSSAVQHAIVAVAPDDRPDAVATLQPTSPLRLPEWLDRCADALTATGFDSAITLSPAHAKVGSVTNGRFLPDYELETRSQELPLKHHENGLIYLTRTESVLGGSVFGATIAAVVIHHPFASIDIDTAADLAYAEAMVWEARG